MKNKIHIFCTLGPSSLNSKFLKYTNNNVSLVRLNMSHIEIKNLKKIINRVRQHTKCPICIDTEGAQIRAKVRKNAELRVGQTIKIFKNYGNFILYPDSVFNRIKVGDVLDIGFDDLKCKVFKINKEIIFLKTLSSGKLENNKGINISNRSIKLDYLTAKDFEAIEIGKKLKIKNYALSFTNSVDDIRRFSKILPNQKKIFKIESKQAIKSFNKIAKIADNFLIDRGDLSKEIKIENIPPIQRKIFKISKKYKKKNIFVATNLLENMIKNKYPTRGEANDIYSTLEMGAKGLVLAAETAIGDFPEESVIFLKKMIKIYEKNH